mmetsp:Transcript_654/g.753  ORF Transcript_654/g.753 Transcript_654/m.753 type:complete len:447 (-) Transcript_654:214-1554(-)|eukprot:CAMPEP_0205822900 /NCGR_PEP_ID=MMETSP0206-20130828/14486_1 /ASSEMBLY_ACC=CAM_ASM_000279 /TAXON_ID=36767 /ORGANISM="Euplotes focardii, Strain TN1" /LENGTH=446 /DNA_ID=CAMNT_0053119559 /DNA_START=28 /DNA_END=1368 /DNA_ORIENTATION=-
MAGRGRRPSGADLKEAAEAAAFQDKASQVLGMQIPWAVYERSGLITAKELGLVRDYDGAEEDEKIDLLFEQGQQYANFFVKAIESIRTDRGTTEYLLTLVDQLLQGDQNRAKYFHTCSTGNPYAPFMSILSRPNESEYTVSKACHILSVLLSTNPEQECPDLADFVKWVTSRLGTSKGRAQVHTLGALKDVLKRHESQMLFIKYGGLRTLISFLRKETQNTQLLYLAGFCVWLLTFNPEAHAHLKAHDVVRKLIEIVKLVIREKVVRICFCALRNLLGHENFNESMIANGLPKALHGLAARKWKDQDLVDDIAHIGRALSTAIEDLSSFEIYQAELQSGRLSWTPVHSERFWRENCSKFDERNFELVRMLVALLETEHEVTLEVACYDMGEFARFHPDGRRVIQALGGKQRLMMHMEHHSAKVSKQALMSVQKLLVTHWEFLDKAQ